MSLVSFYTSSVLIFACTYFVKFANFDRFHKIKYTRNFLLNGIYENKYTSNMHKIHISHKKKYVHKKCWLIQLFF